MKSKFIIIFFLFWPYSIALSENLFIESKNISIDKKNELTVFRDDVVAKTKDNYVIKSQYGEYSKKNKTLILKDKVKGLDQKNNSIDANYYWNISNL